MTECVQCGTPCPSCEDYHKGVREAQEEALKAADLLAYALERYMFHVVRAPAAFVDIPLQEALETYQKSRSVFGIKIKMDPTLKPGEWRIEK